MDLHGSGFMYDYNNFQHEMDGDCHSVVDDIDDFFDGIGHGGLGGAEMGLGGGGGGGLGNVVGVNAERNVNVEDNLNAVDHPRPDELRVPVTVNQPPEVSVKI